MKRRDCFLIAIPGLLFGAIPQAAQACSFSWNPGYSPREIRHRSDVRRIQGTFRIIDMQGNVDGEGQLVEGTIYGRIEKTDGKRFDTVQSFSQFEMECGADRRPVKDGAGTFWIKRHPKEGKFQMMLWEGKYSDIQSWTGSRK